MRALAAATYCLLAWSAIAAAAEPSLATRYRSLRPALAASDFGVPLHIASTQDGGAVRGDVDAVVPHRFAVVRELLRTPAQWCEVLILHVNVRQCLPVEQDGQPALSLAVGRKLETDLDDTAPLVLAFRLESSTPRLLRVRLSADEGPYGTGDYDLLFEAAPLQGGRSYVHLAFSQTYGRTAQLALRGYLGTLARDRVGFTEVGSEPDGSPQLVGGLRGAIERNAMRYYLAVDTCLDTASVPEPERRRARLEQWFEATTRYPRQLQDLTREQYFASKAAGVRSRG